MDDIQFNIGKLLIGKGAPVIVQSMTNTATDNVDATFLQCLRMIENGTQMIRVTVPNVKDADYVKQLSDRLKIAGFGDVPLIADVHFNPKAAEKVAPFVQKVRVNPGNFTDKRTFSNIELSDVDYNAAINRMSLRAKPLLEICKQHDTAIRIGINHGSLCDRIVNRYGNTPEAMVESALEWIDICEDNDFYKIVLSMKSSNVLTMMQATDLLHKKMIKRGRSYPIHLGVTEAGNNIEARTKSAAGIGAMLLSGIGNTIRVSLTEPPENEAPFAHKLIDSIKNIDVNNLKIKDQTLYLDDTEADYERWLCRASAICGYANYHHQIKDLKLSNPNFSNSQISDLESIILQSCRIKISNTEFIACPSCGRTQYDIQRVFEIVKERFSGFANLKIGVMGCIVNGPGEMADADFGIVGATNELLCVYKGKQRISEPLPVNQALDLLQKSIENYLEK